MKQLFRSIHFVVLLLLAFSMTACGGRVPMKSIASSSKSSSPESHKPKTTGHGVQTDLVSIRADGPREVAAHEEFPIDITILARRDVADIRVTAWIPEGATFVRAEPNAAVSGKRTSWSFPAMFGRDKNTMRLWLRAGKDGCYQTCAAVQAIPMVCHVTAVGTPALSIIKGGPDRLFVGDCCRYVIKVTNTGNALARNVVLTDYIPDGLKHESGKNTLEYDIGNLAAGECRTVPIDFTASARGEVCNRVTATSDNAGQASAEKCTLIAQPQVEVIKQGPSMQFVDKEATYQIVVTNTGDTMLHDVLVADKAPSNTCIVDAPGASMAGNTASWKIDKLAPGASKGFEITLKGLCACTCCNQVRVVSREACTAQAEACTTWRGHAAMLIEVVDTQDPLVVGDCTTYKVTIVNQGTAADHNVKVIAKFPDGIVPLKANGDTKAEVNGQVASFEAFPELQPRESISFFIQARAASVGDQRLRVELYSDLLRKPVVEEESTHVY